MRNMGDRGNSSEIRVSIRLMRETMGSFSRRMDQRRCKCSVVFDRKGASASEQPLKPPSHVMRCSG